jgi:SAM-dependent methyltransferase
MEAHVDQGRAEAFMGQLMTDMGAAATVPLVILGDRLGLFTALADAGRSTPEELAQRSSTDARYTREWLNAQAAAGYVSYDAEEERYFLDEVQELVFAREGQPMFMAGAFENFMATMHAVPRMVEAFKSGEGVGWHEQHPCLFRATERFFRLAYNAHLVSEWLPSLDGVVEKLQAGATVADVGCGHGASTIVMAKAFPKSRFFGFDYHGPSIERAREAAEEEGVADRIEFQALSAKEIDGSYDLICVFDALHDMGDPVGAAAHIRSSLAEDGCFMLVEPFANDRTEDNLNPVGRIFYAGSTMVCTPASRSQEVGLALGAQAGEARLKQVLEEAGFTRIRRAAETPFNLIFDVRA